MTDPGYPGQIALQYWMFYVFNDWNNLHEGDWEMIQLNFHASTAAEALQRDAERGRLQPARGRRASGVGRPQARARRRHAPGRLPGRRLARELLRGGALPRRVRLAGRRLRRHPKRGPASTRPVGRRSSRATRPRPARSSPGSAFEGRWGELQPAFFNGPTGPNLKTPVDAADPLVAGLARPGLRGAGRRRAGDADDRLLLRRDGRAARGCSGSAVRDPLPTIVGVLVAVALLVYALSRATWRPTAPLRAGPPACVGADPAAARLACTSPGGGCSSASACCCCRSRC